MRFFKLRESISGSLWFVPSMCVLGAVILALVLIRIDRAGFKSDFIFVGGADGARGFLSTISSSMITLTGLVFTITVVVLQLASQQYSPRVLRTFLGDRHSQLALGIFTATFTYALVVLREVRGDDSSGDAFVPSLAVTVAFLFVLASLALFVNYIHQITQSIRVGNITRSIGDETRLGIEKLYGDADVPGERSIPDGLPVRTLTAPSRGILQGVDKEEMVEFAGRWDAVVEIVPAIGDFVPQDSPIIRVHNPPPTGSEDLLGCVNLGRERTMQQDPPFGFRQLVDIAERALSPSMNDPTTAVQCLDEIHNLLRLLATRPFSSGQLLDDAGSLRLVQPAMTWEAYVRLAFDEIRAYGKGSLQIQRRLRSAILDLLEVALPERDAALHRQLRLLEASTEREWADPEDRASARVPDAQGIGRPRRDETGD